MAILFGVTGTEEAIYEVIRDICGEADSYELSQLLSTPAAEEEIEACLKRLHQRGLLRSSGRAYNQHASGFRIRYAVEARGAQSSKNPRRRNIGVPRLEHWRIIAAIQANPGIKAGEILREMGYVGDRTKPSDNASRIAYLRLKQSLLALSTAGRIRWENGTNASGQHSRAYFVVPSAAPACPGCGRYFTRPDLRRMLEMSVSSAPAPEGSGSPQTDAGPGS